MFSEPFWTRKTLAELDPHEWESLCDGCGKCCLHKLEDEDTGRIAFTNVACRLLDIHSCRCSNYPNRKRYVPDCLQLDVRLAHKLKWLPDTCGYRRVAEGRPLDPSHPLISGNAESIHESGVSVRASAVSERDAGDLEDHVTGWLDP